MILTTHQESVFLLDSHHSMVNFSKPFLLQAIPSPSHVLRCLPIMKTEEQGGEGQTKFEHTNTEGRIGRIALTRSTKPIVAKWKGVISLPQLA